MTLRSQECYYPFYMGPAAKCEAKTNIFTLTKLRLILTQSAKFHHNRVIFMTFMMQRSQNRYMGPPQNKKPGQIFQSE